MDPPVLSLVTGTYNRPESLQRLIRSVEHCTPMPWELIVADASQEPVMGNHDERVRLIPERPRLGFVKGYNRAFRLAQGKWVIWLNDDIEVQKGYAEKAVAFMEANPSIGLGALYYAEDNPPFRVYGFQGMLYANFGIISRALGEAVGWFDEDLVMYGSDNSLAFRVLLAGKGIASIPGARVWHHVMMDQAKTTNQLLRPADSRKLHIKYLSPSMLRRMNRVYEANSHLSGPEVDQ